MNARAGGARHGHEYIIILVEIDGRMSPTGQTRSWTDGGDTSVWFRITDWPAIAAGSSMPMADLELDTLGPSAFRQLSTSEFPKEVYQRPQVTVFGRQKYDGS